MKMKLVILLVVVTQLYGVSGWNGRSDHTSKVLRAKEGQEVSIPIPVDTAERLAVPDSDTKKTCLIVGAAAFFVCLKLIPWAERKIRDN